MLNDWYPRLHLPLSASDLSLLPRHPGYAYRVTGDGTELIPQPQLAHTLLSLGDPGPAFPPRVTGVPIQPGDWPALSDLFREAFESSQPFASLSADQRDELVRECIDRTRAGQDGLLIPDATILVRREGDQRLMGACLLSLTPAGPLDDFSSPLWSEAPPEKPIAERWGRPHLTWIMVSPVFARQGIATQLLGQAVAALRQLGYRELSSTLLTDNLPSLLWHWKSGFRLVALPGASR